MPRPRRQFNAEDAFTHKVPDFDDQQAMADFKKRQEEDLKRWQTTGLQRRRPFHKRTANNAAEQDGSFDRLLADVVMTIECHESIHLRQRRENRLGKIER